MEEVESAIRGTCRLRARAVSPVPSAPAPPVLVSPTPVAEFEPAASAPPASEPSTPVSAASAAVALPAPAELAAPAAPALVSPAPTALVVSTLVSAELAAPVVQDCAGAGVSHRAVASIGKPFFPAVAAFALVFAVIAMCAFWAPDHANASEFYEDGVYEVDVTALQYASDQASMCDNALEKPARVSVSGGKATLLLSLKPISTSGLTGYLGYVSQFPRWSGAGDPDPADLVPARVISSYDDVVDDYNKANSSDGQMRGATYPQVIALEWDLSADTGLIQVYVPVMAAINPASGWQYARLRVDRSTMRKVAEAGSDADGKGGGGGAVLGDEAGSGSGSDAEAPSSATSSESDAAYARLARTISVAQSKLSDGNEYTDESRAGLEEAMREARTAYERRSADVAAVEALRDKLNLAIGGLVSKGSSSTSEGGSAAAAGSSGGTISQSGSSKGKAVSKLNFKKLPDGVYTVSGTVVKPDRETASMADQAIAHEMILKVKNGAYRLVLRLSSVAVGTTSSYLSRLKYFRSGYATDSAGAPSGLTSSAKVLSYQKANGMRVVDAYGTDYPAKVQIPVIAEARSDGFVPLRVFVPVMEALAAGSGTQVMYLKLDRGSVAKKGASEGEKDDQDAVASGESPDASTGSGGSMTQSGFGLGNAADSLIDGGARLAEGSTLGSGAITSASALSGLGGQAPAGEGSRLLSEARRLGTAMGRNQASEYENLTRQASATSDDSLDGRTIVRDDETPQPPLKGAAVYLIAGVGGIAVLVVARALIRRRSRLFG